MKDVNCVPATVLGAAWKPQFERMTAGIYFPLFLVLVTKDRRHFAINYLPSDLQREEMFVKRAPLGPGAKRAGWEGYVIQLAEAQAAPIRLL